MALGNTYSQRWRESEAAGFPVWRITLDWHTGKGFAVAEINSAGARISTPEIGRRVNLQVDAASLTAFQTRTRGTATDVRVFNGLLFNTGQALSAVLADTV